MPTPSDAESLRLLYFSVKFAGKLNTDMQKVADAMGLPSARAAGERLKKLMTRMQAMEDGDPVDETPKKKRVKPANQGSGSANKRGKPTEEATLSKPKKKQDELEDEVKDEDCLEEGETSD